MLDLTPKLFPLLFQHKHLKQPISILDFGCATSETVNFFSQFQCGLCFADFVSEQQIPVDPSELSDDQLVAAYATHLNFLGDRQFDIFLFWDFFSLLDARSMKAFNAALYPYMTENAQAYGFGALSRRGTLEYLDYRIVDFQEFRVASHARQPVKIYAHGQSSFESQMPPFKVKKGVLLNTGRLEILLERRE